jgi:hypothetical protein
VTGGADRIDQIDALLATPSLRAGGRAKTAFPTSASDGLVANTAPIADDGERKPGGRRLAAMIRAKNADQVRQVVVEWIVVGVMDLVAVGNRAVRFDPDEAVKVANCPGLEVGAVMPLRCVRVADE